MTISMLDTDIKDRDGGGEDVASSLRADHSHHNHHEELPFPKIHGLCIMDAGKQGVIMLSDHIFALLKY
jgi:hypothetical protein